MKKRNKNLWLTALIIAITFGDSSGQNKTESTPPLIREISCIIPDRDIYAPGERIYYSCFLVNQPKISESFSGVYYVDLIDGEGRLHDRRKTRMEAGSGQGYINLSDTLTPGQYWLRGYSRYTMLTMPQNIYAHTILVTAEHSSRYQLLHSSGTISQIYFYPEGGHLIPDIPCRVIAVAVNENKMPVPFEGTLLDETGTIVAHLLSDSYGMAEFVLSAAEGQQFETQISTPSGRKKFTGPLLSPGPVIHLKRKNDETIQVLIHFDPNGIRSGRLELSTPDKIILQRIINRGENETALDLHELPGGLMNFKLYSDDDVVVSERLFFNELEYQSCYIDIETDLVETDSSRNLIIGLESFDDEGLPCHPAYNVRIIHETKETYINWNNENHFTIGNYVDQSHSEFLFYNLDISDQIQIEKFLLTQKIKSIPDRLQMQDILLSVEKSLDLTGTIYYKDKPFQTKGFFSDISNLMDLQEFQSDDFGRFRLSDIKIVDTSDFIFFINPGNKKTKSNKQTFSGDDQLSIIFDNDDWISAVDPESLPAAGIWNFFEKLEDHGKIGLSVDLDPVEIKAKRLDSYIAYHKPGMLYSRPDDRVTVDTASLASGHYNVIDFLKGKVPNFTVTGEEGGGSRQVILRGRSTGLSRSISMSNAAQFMVNGFAVSQAYVESINPVDIAFVDILRSLSQTSVYGEFGRNGIIAIYLKPPHQRYRKPVEREGLISHVMVGYVKPLPFQATDPPGSSTIFWSGIQKLNKEGKKRISVPIGDVKGDFYLILEGVTTSGTPVFIKEKLSIS